MKRIAASLFILCSYLSIQAQSTIEIDLSKWDNKPEKTPFSINSVVDNRTDPTKIGTLQVSKNKEKEIEFASNSAEIIQQFLLKNFEPEHEMSIRMEVEQLDIQEIKLKRNKTMTAFLFACKFYKIDGSNEPLYAFNARNSILKKNNLESAMTDYLGRAIQAAVLNFKKAYKKHPEWKTAQASSSQVKMKKEISFNQFMGGDTIALDGRYKLKPSDFAGIVGEEEKDDAYSFFIMTYTLQAEDESDQISLQIAPKAFFLRSKSWAKKDSTNNWLAYQQLLFDLASYHAYSFKKQIEEKELSPGFYKTEMNQIYNKTSASYFDEMDDMQAQTQYGTNAKKVQEWRAKVDDYLGLE